MKRHKTWTKKLTASEKKHIRECFGGMRISRERVRQTREFQASSGIDCFECRSIAIKAGIEG